MKKTYIFLLLCSLSAIAHSVYGQVTGTKTIGVDYASVAAAVTALNATGVSGNVVINIPAGYTETAPAGGFLLGSAVLNASTSSSSTLTFQKSGTTGLDPLLTAPIGTSTSTDGIFIIQGTDYVTINGIDLTESAANTTATTQMEWGYALVKRQSTAPFDGCQNVTIQNCTITLNKANTASVGIYSGNHIATSTTALTITSTIDATNNCSFSGNTISNVNRCVSLSGFLTAVSPYTLYDQNNTIGGTSAGSGNSLTNFGGTATAGYGIYLAGQNNAIVGYNTITSATTPGTASIYGIFHGIGTNSSFTVTKNTFQLTLGSSNSMYGIANGTGAAGTGISGTAASIIVSQNTFQNYSFTAANSASQYPCLYNYAGTTSGWDLGSLKILGNIVQNFSLNATGSHYFFYNYYCNSNDVRFNDNKMSGLRRTSTSGTTYLYYNYYGSPTGGADSAMRNKITACSSPSSLYGVYSFGSTVIARNKVYMYDTVTYDTVGLSVSSSLLDCVYAYSGNDNIVANNYCAYNYGNPTNSSTIYGPLANNGTNHIVRDNIYTNNISYSHYGIYAISADVNSDVYNNTVTNNTSSTGTTYSLYCLGGGTENVYNNIVTNNNATGSGPIYGIYHTTSPLSSIHDNTFYNLSSTGGNVYGVYILGGTTTNVYNNTIGKLVNTGTTGGSVAGLYTSSGTTINFYDNTVDTLTTAYTSGTAYGVYESGPTNLNCYRNKISYIASLGASGSVNGIYLNSGTTNVYNNLVGNLQLPASSSITGTNLVGIYCGTANTTTGHTLSYNTVVLNATTTGTAYSSSALYSSTTYPLKANNNIFINTSQQLGTGTVAAYRRSSATITSYNGTSNNNLFYAGTPGPYNAILFDATTNYSTIPTYQAVVTPADANSVTENTTFQSQAGIGTNFLRPSLTVGTQIESSAINIAGITNDVYQTTRAGNTGYSGTGTAPDLGAVEDSYTLADLSAPGITYTPLSFTCATGDRTLTATITDLSGVASGSLSPRVYYKKGSGTWYSSPGTLSSGTATSGTWTFTIAAATMGGVTLGDAISYYVLAQDVATTPNVGSMPIGAVATNVNTVTTNPTTPNTYSVTSTLSGTFNVGVGQTYATITDAVNAYNNSCISGPVIFQLTDATYPGETFPITINSNAFASSTTTLTIKPAAGVSPVITGSATSIFKLNGVDYVTIDGSNSGSSSRNLTITNTNTAATATAVIWIASPGASDGATNNTIKNCAISGNASTTTEMCIFSGAATGTGAFSSTSWLPLSPNSNTLIQNNSFMKSQYGVWLKGPSTTVLDQSASVQNNNFGTATTGEGFNSGGLVLQFQNNAIASGNDIQNVQGAGGVSNAAGSSTVFTGLYIRQCTNVQVSANKIHGMNLTAANRAHALYVESPAFNTASSPSNNLIVNNAIYDARITATGSTSWTISGISANGGYGDKFYYNTVDLTGVVNVSSGPAAAFSNGNVVTSTVTSNIEVKDNIFVINGSSTGSAATFYATYWQTAAAVTSSVTDYNNLYSAITSGGTASVGYGGSASATLTAWQTATSQEAHSLSLSPLFVSTTDVHLQTLTANAGLAAGIPIVSITTDMFGATRSSTTPVMGVHEVSFATVPPTIAYSTLSGACGWTDRTVTATIGDLSTGVPTTGALVPRVYYRKNTGTWYSRPGSMTSGSGSSGTWSFTIVAADMGTGVVGDVISYYVTAQTNAGYVGSSPSSGFVATDVNTVTTPPTTPNTYGVLPALSGTYNVGTAGAYTTITSAVSAYNSSCLSGPVVFQLTDATYPGETFPITLSGNSYASPSTILTIKPAMGVTPVITGSVTTAIFKLNGTDYVTIDGSNTAGGTTRDLTITNTITTTTGTTAIWIASATSTDGATNNTIKNCIISGNSSTSTEMCIFSGAPSGTGAFSLGYAALTANSNNTIQNNKFMKSQYGVWLKGMVTTTLDQNNKIIGNDFGTATTGEGFSGIALTMQLQNNAVVSKNIVQNVQGTGGINNAAANMVVFCGIYLRQNTNALVSSNKIFNLNLTGGPNKVHVLYLESPAFNTAANPSNNTIVNNAIYDARTSSTTVTGWALSGISANAGYGDKFYYNTVNLTGVISAVSLPAAAFSNGNAGTTVQTSNVVLKDNIFNINGSSTGSTATLYSNYWQSATAISASALDYNDLRCVSTGGATAYTGYDGFARSLISDWQSAISQEAHSINTNPVFVAPNDIRLQIVPANLPFISGTPISGITTDIFDTTRDAATPVIGAHEVRIPPCSGTPTAGTVTTSPASGCATFTSNLGTSGTTSGVYGITYQWQSSPDGVASYTDISGATNPTYSPTITSSTFYRAVIGCAVTSTSSATAGVPLISNPNPDAITGTGVICVGGNLSLASTTTGGTWSSSAASIATVDPSTGFFTGVSAGTATVTYTIPSTGCIATTVATVSPTPSLYTITPGASATCITGPAQLLTASNTTVPNGGTIGTQQNINANTAYPAPLSMYYGAQRCQVLVLASELTAKGFIAGSTLTGMDMQVLTLGSGYTLNSLQVRIAPTAVSALSSFVTAGLVTVKSPANYTPTVGNNSLGFTAPYLWDGTSNLVFDLTFGNSVIGSTTTAATQYNTNTSFVSTLVYRLNSTSAATAATATTISASYSQRPDFTLSGTNPVTPVWGPLGSLYTDAAATIPYTGTATSSVYALPSSMTTYTATATKLVCSTTANATLSVNPLPAVISGSNTVCFGLTTTLSNDTTGGTWSSSASAIAAINATTGVVTGAAVGTATITYTKSSTGCFRTMVMTVNPLPLAITGTASLCEAATTSLGDPNIGGTWSTDAASVAIVGSGNGVVTGVSAGFAQITYTLPTSCITVQQVTVNPVPALSVTPTPVPNICYGSTTTLSAGATMNNFALMSQDFNAGLGAWAITNIDGNATSDWHLTASPGYSGTTGDGSQMIQAAPDAYAGITSTRFTSPSFSTVGYGAVTLSFNEYLLSLSSSDGTVAVEYSTDGGTLWNTVLDQVDNIVGSGSWTSSSPEVSVALPAGAVGQPNVKLRWNYYSIQGLWWGVDNIKVTAAMPAPSYTWSGASGLSCTSCTSVTVTPAATGANVYSLSATTTTGCVNSTSVIVSVNPLPSTIGGTLVVCEGSTTTATDADAGGTWSAATTTIATIDPSTGEITGVAHGTAEITYTLPTGCTTTAIVTVNPIPGAIDGTPQVCQGLTTTLSNADAGGTWGSGTTSVADIDASGVVSGTSFGTATITYAFATGCMNTVEVTVNPLPATIGGTLAVCEGLTTTLNDADADGTWSSSSSATAGIGSATGVVTGNAAGTAEVTYTLPTGCITTSSFTVNNTPAEIDGVAPVCVGLTTTFSDVESGGTWSSGNTAIANIDASGVVTGMSDGTATITYALPTGCIITAEMTVNPLPASIGGTPVVCEGLTMTLTESATGGTWSSSSSATAGIGSATGVVTGNSAGTAVITYALSTGCIATTTFTVNHTPATIGVTLQVCEGSTTSLNNTETGGAWSIGAAGIATINTSGVVSGLLSGNATVTYTLPTGCITTSVITVNPMPASIGGTMVTCQGASTTLTDGTGGGTWSSGATSVAAVGSTSGLVTGLSAGFAPITYTMPGGCYVAANVTVNATPAAIVGISQVCIGSSTTLTDPDLGGSWASSAPGIASVSTAGIVSGLSMGTASISYALSAGCVTVSVVTVVPLPAPIVGSSQLCVGATGTFADGTPGGTWESTTPLVATIDAITGSATAMGSGTTIIKYTSIAGCMRTRVLTVNAVPTPITGSSVLCRSSSTTLVDATPGGTWSSGAGSVATINASGLLSGVNPGVAPIVYTLATGCSTITTVTVNELPAAIGGSSSVCQGQTTSLSNSVTGGTWSSGTPGNAFVDGTTGVVTGMGIGSSAISYTLPTGCGRSVTVVVNEMPSAISGATDVCQGTTTTMTTASTGGVWTSSVTSIASINLSTGVATWLAAGTANISYTIPSGGCYVIYTVTVDAMPAVITGPFTVCSGKTTTLSSTTTGGTWSSSNMAVATAGASGVVSGVSAGTSVITYTLPSGCVRSTIVTVNALPVSYHITGGGNSCSGSGVHIGLDNSDGGVLYQLYSGAGALGSPVAGITGMAIDFGLIMPAGTYSVMASSITTGCSNNMLGSASVITSVVTPTSVSFASGTGSDTVCSGAPVTFTASAVNGGTAPAYQWKINGVSVAGATSNIYSYMPSSGDVVSINMSSSIACATPLMATASRTIVVSTGVMPVANMTVTPGTSVCVGNTASFNASSSYGGSDPQYIWYKNNAVVAFGLTYSYVPANGDNMVLKLVSNHACALEDTVMSSAVTMTVSPVYTPAVNIIASPGAVIQAGTNVTLTASVTNAGPSPEFQWYIGSAAIAGATSSLFNYSMFADGDSVTCIVKGTGACGLNGFNSIIMHVGGVGVHLLSTISEVRLMPNPNKGEFVVKGTLSAITDKEVDMEVTNMLGQVVYKAKITAHNGSINESVRLSNTLANGMYILSLRFANENKMIHFAIEN